MPPTSEVSSKLAPTAAGSRLEQLLLVGQLLADLASIPFHMAVFLFTRRKHQRRFAEALAAVQTSVQTPVPSTEQTEVQS